MIEASQPSPSEMVEVSQPCPSPSVMKPASTEIPEQPATDLQEQLALLNAAEQEIAHLRTHMSALELEAELRDFWRKEFKEVRYVGNDTFVVAYTLRL